MSSKAQNITYSKVTNTGLFKSLMEQTITRLRRQFIKIYYILLFDIPTLRGGMRTDILLMNFRSKKAAKFYWSKKSMRIAYLYPK